MHGGRRTAGSLARQARACAGQDDAGHNDIEE